MLLGGNPVVSPFLVGEGLLFGVNENLLTQHISGPVTKYKLL